MSHPPTRGTASMCWHQLRMSHPPTRELQACAGTSSECLTHPREELQACAGTSSECLTRPHAPRVCRVRTSNLSTGLESSRNFACTPSFLIVRFTALTLYNPCTQLSMNDGEPPPRTVPCAVRTRVLFTFFINYKVPVTHTRPNAYTELKSRWQA